MRNEGFRSGVPFGPATERAKKILLREDLKILDKITAAGGLEEYVQAHPELGDCFTNEKPYVCCMDERTAKGSIHIPGSGILIEQKSAQADFLLRLKAEGCRGVYSHDNCGAVKLYATQHGLTDYNSAAKEYAKQLSQQLGVEYLGHLKTSGEHPGRAVYIDATGRLDTGSPVWQETMPTGFAVTRGALSATQALESVMLGIKIAFGEHGYGPNMFSDKDPMTLVVIGQDAKETQALQTELLNELPQIIAAIPAAAGKIKVAGFTRPSSTEIKPEVRSTSEDRSTTL